ncbi:MAG TPA: ABC transporter substrate-binding protein [Chloroflexota bacterium]|nr:ABC transporter substrate-binding protein [Chloroflexota bacterium]
MTATLLLSACGGAAAPSAAPASTPSSAAAPGVSSSAAGNAPASGAAKPAASSAAMASAKPAPSGQATKLTVALSSLSASNLPSWVGEQAGIYAKNGLDVTFKVIAGGSTTTSALLGGDVQIVMGGGSEALGAAAGGADLVILGITVPKYTVIIEGPASAKSLKDLKGKTFGVPAARGTVDVSTRIALKSQGMDPDKDVKITSLGSVQAVTAALLSGTIDAAGVNVPDNLAAEDKGLHAVMSMKDADLPAASNSIYTVRSYAAANKDVLQRYVDSVVESIARIKTDRATSIAAIKKNLKLDDDRAAAATYDYYREGVFPALPYPKPEYFKDAQELGGEVNPKVRDFDVSKILDSSFVQSAADRGLDKS